MYVKPTKVRVYSVAYVLGRQSKIAEPPLGCSGVAAVSMATVSCTSGAVPGVEREPTESMSSAFLDDLD